MDFNGLFEATVWKYIVLWMLWNYLKAEKASIHKLQHVYVHIFIDAITWVMIQTFL